jgi:hypothetical protein
LLAEWMSKPISNVKFMQDSGVSALQELLKHPHPLPIKLRQSSELIMNLHDVKSKFKTDITQFIKDLFEFSVQNAVVTKSQTKAFDLDGFAVFKSILMAGEEEWTEEHKLLSAFNVPSTNVEKAGIAVPNCISPDKDPNVFHFWDNDSKNQTAWTSVITGRGAITEAHIDEVTLHAHMIHIHGRKLWLFWPPTPENLEFLFRNKHFSETRKLPVDLAIKNLKGLEVLFIDDEKIGFSIPPSTIHAVMSFSKISGHTGFFFGLQADVEKCQKIFDVIFQLIEEDDQDPETSGYKETDFLLYQWDSLTKGFWMSFVHKLRERKFSKSRIKAIDDFLVYLDKRLEEITERRPWMDDFQPTHYRYDIKVNKNKVCLFKYLNNLVHERAKEVGRKIERGSHKGKFC